jgi:uncharacterized protein
MIYTRDRMQRYELRDRRALVTGASSGIGRALALELGARGARLAILARRERRLERLADAVETMGGSRPLIVVADLSRRGAAALAAADVEAEFGGVDVLVNNAGGAVGGSVWAVADGDAARADFEVDVWSPLALIGAFVPGMRNRGHGAVVNVTSLRQVLTWPSFGQNSGAQAALAQITETLRLELVADGVHVVEVIPGPVETAMQGPTRLLPGITEAFHDRLGVARPEEVASATVAAIETGAERVFAPEASGRRVWERPAEARAQIAGDVRRLLGGLPPNEAIDSLVVDAEHELIRVARDRWEQEHGDAPPTECQA